MGHLISSSSSSCCCVDEAWSWDEETVVRMEGTRKAAAERRACLCPSADNEVVAERLVVDAIMDGAEKARTLVLLAHESIMENAEAVEMIRIWDD